MDAERLEKIFIGIDATVRQAIASIDAGAIEIALVVTEGRRLVGTITDGDVRRALMADVGLDDPIETDRALRPGHRAGWDRPRWRCSS